MGIEDITDQGAGEQRRGNPGEGDALQTIEPQTILYKKARKKDDYELKGTVFAISPNYEP